MNVIIKIFVLALLVLTLPTLSAAIQPTNHRFIVYWGGWEGMNYDLKRLPAKITAVNLAFADLVNNEVDTSISGYLTNLPKENGSQLQPSYINWTQFKFYHPNTKILLSLGGSTFSQIWTHKLNTETIDEIAKNIATVINRNYPVYRSNFAKADDKLGEVSIDGIDLDVEAGGTRLTTEMTTNVNKLIQSLRIYLDKDKLVTFTGFSVGADPINQCTVPGSVHCGEDIDILVQSCHYLNWVNVMAYDAGREFADTKYQIALQNFANYVGKQKVILGVDLQTQWDPNQPFQETAKDLAIKAGWEMTHQYGGVMLWGVNVTNNPTMEQTYVEAIAEQLMSIKSVAK